MKHPVTVAILAKNEEDVIARCVSSARWADEVLVLDTGSQDRTVAIAQEMGATVYERPWTNWSKAHNQSILLAKHDWVLFLDADEIITPQLAQAIQTMMQSDPDPRNGYYVSRSHDMLGALMRDEARPSKKKGLVRLINRQYNLCDEAQQVHESLAPVGQALPLSGQLLHWRGYTMDQHFLSFNRYATWEAYIWGEEGVRATGVKILVKPMLRFLWCYVYKQAFRRGVPGLIYSMTRATWEFMWLSKLWERQNLRDPAIHPRKEIYFDPYLGELETKKNRSEEIPVTATQR